MVFKSVADLSVELFRTCAVVEVGVSRYECAICQIIEVCERNTSRIAFSVPDFPFNN